MRERVVLHLDMDAFYAAIEVRDDPRLAGLPLIVGHRGRRGVVATCSYEARRFGVRSAMPSLVAERLCPQAVWVAGRMPVYVEVSQRIRAILERFSPTIEPLSIDEAFCDLSGIARDLEGGAGIGRELKRTIREACGLTGSVGVAPVKFLAKVASDLEKPDGLVVLSLADLPARLWPLPVERLWGVGPRLGERLRGAGLTKVGDVLRVPLRDLSTIAGPATAAHLQALARGEDEREVTASRRAQSISEERTYETDLVDPAAIDRALLARAEGVSRELRRSSLVAHTVQLKVRDPDFRTWTRAVTLPAPTDLAETIVAAARELYRTRIRLEGRGVRLLGVGVSALEPASAAQESLFPDPQELRARRAARAADAVRERLGGGGGPPAPRLMSGSAAARSREPG
jgi:DNA polymerase-4